MQLFNSVKAAASSGKQYRCLWCELAKFYITTVVCEPPSPGVWDAAAGKLDPVRNEAQPRCHHHGELKQLSPPGDQELLLAPMTWMQSSFYTRNEKHLMALVILLDQASEIKFLILHHTIHSTSFYFTKGQLHAEVYSRITTLRLFGLPS